MFKKKSKSLKKYDVLISPRSTFEGKMEIDGAVMIEGNIHGNLKINGDVYIGKKSSIVGNISANNIYVSGIVRGNITSKGTLTVPSSAKLFGNVKALKIEKSEGSIIIGKCSIGQVKSPAKKTSAGKASFGVSMVS